MQNCGKRKSALIPKRLIGASLFRDRDLNRSDGQARLTQPLIHILGQQLCQEAQNTKMDDNCYKKLKSFIVERSRGSQREENENGLMQHASTLQASLSKLELDFQQEHIKRSTTRICSPTCIAKDLKTHQHSKNKFTQAIRKKCYSQLHLLQKQHNIVSPDEIRQIMDDKISTALKGFTLQQSSSYEKIIGEKECLEQALAEKEILIQGLNLRETRLREELSRMYITVSEQNMRVTAKTRGEIFQKEYYDLFGDLTLNELKKDLDSKTSYMANNFASLDRVYDEAAKERNEQHKYIVMKLKSELEALRNRVKQLTEEQREHEKQEHLRMGGQACFVEQSLLIARAECTEYRRLKDVIFERYSKWHEERSPSEILMMKDLDIIRQDYSSERMIQHMLAYKGQLSDSGKLNRFISKLLGGLKKIRKVLHPTSYNEPIDVDRLLKEIEARLKRGERGKPSKKMTTNSKESDLA